MEQNENTKDTGPVTVSLNDLRKGKALGRFSLRPFGLMICR